MVTAILFIMLYMWSLLLCLTNSHWLINFYRLLANKESKNRMEGVSENRVEGQELPATTFMWEHCVEKHGGVPGQDHHLDFEFTLLSTHRSPLERQIAEAIRIQGLQDQGRDIGAEDAWAKAVTWAWSSPPSTTDSEPVSRMISMNRRGEGFAPLQKDWKKRNFWWPIVAIWWSGGSIIPTSWI